MRAYRCISSNTELFASPFSGLGWRNNKSQDISPTLKIEESNIEYRFLSLCVLPTLLFHFSLSLLIIAKKHTPRFLMSCITSGLPLPFACFHPLIRENQGQLSGETQKTRTWPQCQPQILDLGVPVGLGEGSRVLPALQGMQFV